MSKNIHRVPHYLKELTLDDLHKAMHENNIRRDAEHLYFDIQPDKQFWVAWYYTTASYVVNPPSPIKAPLAKKKVTRRKIK